MNIKKWVSLFWKTLLIGVLTYFVVGCIAQWNDLAGYMSKGDPKGVTFVLVNFIIFGGLFSVLSQMGFFAYLTLHRIALGMFRSYWNMIQLFLIAVTFFDLVYFRYITSHEHLPLIFYFILPIVLGAISYLVAKKKWKETNRHAYIPTLFFLFVITTIEWIVGLSHNSEHQIIWEIGLTLMACNAYQVLQLHRLIQKD